jgi:putative flippase GtrA
MRTYGATPGVLDMNFGQFVTKGIKFGLVGAAGTVLNLGLLYALTEYGHVYYLYSELAAIIIVFAFNYIGNILVGNIKLDKEKKNDAV